MAKYILRNILLLVAISLQLNLSAQNKATGLQTDLINDAGTLYQNGYRSDKTMAELNDSEFSQYQYAAIRSSRPTFSDGLATSRFSAFSSHVNGFFSRRHDPHFPSKTSELFRKHPLPSLPLKRACRGLLSRLKRFLILPHLLTEEACL